MRSSQIVLISLFISIALFLAALFSYEHFVDLITPDIPGVQYTTTNTSGEFNDSIIFAFAIGLIPLASAVVWKYGQIRRSSKRIASVALILLFMLVFFFARFAWIQFDISQIKSAVEDNSTTRVPTNDFNVEWYMLIGLIIGALVSFITLRKSMSGRR